MMNSPAVVIGGDLNPLGIVRSLAAGGVPTVVLATDATEPAMRSRYGRKVLVPGLEGTELIEALLRIAQSFSGRAVLFLTEEKTVRTVSEHRVALEARYFIRLPPHELLMRLMHKQGFQEFAEAYHAPVPHTLQLRSPYDLGQATTMRYPCVLKPAYKHYGYGAKFKKAYVVETVNEVERLYKEIAPTLADLVLQEWIEGGDHDIYFCLQYVGEKGVTIASFTGRKIRAWPPKIGGTASCTAAWDMAAELTAATARFFSEVGFTGMGSMEYKRDPRDGRFYMVEPTVARTDFQEEVATLNGINLPLVAYRHELGLEPPRQHKKTPARIWREPVTDRWSLREQGPAPAGVAAGAQVCDAYFRLDDPLPALDLIGRRLKSRLFG